MNVDRVAHVEADRHRGVGEVERAALLIAEGAPGTAVVEARDLDEQEGEIALLPLAAPVGDEGGEDPLVERGAAVAGVGFALIPDDASEGEGSGGRDHGVEKGGGPPRIEIGVPVL